MREAWTKSYRRKWHTQQANNITPKDEFQRGNFFFFFLFLSVNLEGVGRGHKIVAGDERLL